MWVGGGTQVVGALAEPVESLVAEVLTRLKLKHGLLDELAHQVAVGVDRLDGKEDGPTHPG